MFPPMTQTTERARIQNEARERDQKAAHAAQVRPAKTETRQRDERPTQTVVREQVGQA